MSKQVGNLYQGNASGVSGNLGGSTTLDEGGGLTQNVSLQARPSEDKRVKRIVGGKETWGRNEGIKLLALRGDRDKKIKSVLHGKGSRMEGSGKTLQVTRTGKGAPPDHGGLRVAGVEHLRKIRERGNPTKKAFLTSQVHKGGRNDNNDKGRKDHRSPAKVNHNQAVRGWGTHQLQRISE